ncbi:mitochondrial ribosomal protein subunit S18 [Cryomyces antarcticus]
MSKRTAARLFTSSSPSSSSSSLCTKCRSSILSRLPVPLNRSFASTAHHRAPNDNDSTTPSKRPTDALASLLDSFPSRQSKGGLNSFLGADVVSSLSTTVFTEPPAHHLHIYATKHNTHITLTKPSRDAIISVSAGNIGFRKAGRGSYDAAYQLAAYVMNRIQEQGLTREIQRLEVVLRGFGAGREAVTKALMGSEGRNLRGKVVGVSDSTRLKFGGTRSKKPRRLG